MGGPVDSGAFTRHTGHQLFVRSADLEEGAQVVQQHPCEQSMCRVGVQFIVETARETAGLFDIEEVVIT